MLFVARERKRERETERKRDTQPNLWLLRPAEATLSQFWHAAQCSRHVTLYWRPATSSSVNFFSLSRHPPNDVYSFLFLFLLFFFSPLRFYSSVDRRDRCIRSVVWADPSLGYVHPLSFSVLSRPDLRDGKYWCRFLTWEHVHRGMYRELRWILCAFPRCVGSSARSRGGHFLMYKDFSRFYVERANTSIRVIASYSEELERRTGITSDRNTFMCTFIQR